MEYFMNTKTIVQNIEIFEKKNQVEKSTNFFVNLFMKIKIRKIGQ